MTRPPDAIREIPATRTLAMLASEMESRHAKEWQAALLIAAQEAGIDLERFAFDQATRTWVDQTQPKEEGPVATGVHANNQNEDN